MMRQFHANMMARVLDDGDASEAFPVTIGVKQGCVLAPTLFSMMFTVMLTDVFHTGEDGISLRYIMDGKLFNQRRLQAITKMKKTVLRDFLIADDCALNASSEPEMQHSMDKLSSPRKNLRPYNKHQEAEVLHQPAPNNPIREPSIQVNGQTLQAVDRCTYSGSTLSRSVTADDEVNSRIAKASSAFGRLRTTVDNLLRSGTPHTSLRL